MFRHTCFASALLALACAIFAAPAPAADNTRYVSITGKNTNPCTLAQPCKSLQRGINATPAGGEVRILESGFYGNNANIRKSLTISGNGNTVYLGAPVTINKADAIVALRGLVLDGQGQDIDGVLITAAAVVHIERCVVHSFGERGILQDGADARLFILDSIVRDNVGEGARVDGGAAAVTVDNSRFENNSIGLLIIGADITAAVSRTVAARNGNGIRLNSASVNVMSTIAAHNTSFGLVANSGTLTVESSAVRGSFVGLHVAPGALSRISNSTFTENTTGINNNGTIETRGNNTVRGNTTDLSGNALTPIGGI